MNLYEIYFSPTGGTKKVADIMIKAMKKDAQEIDMIKDPDKILQTEFSEDDICLIAVPSYGGTSERDKSNIGCCIRKQSD